MKHLLNGPMLAAKSGKTDSVVVMLHGVGSNGRDLISLAPLLAEEFPSTTFISPNAPEEFFAGGDGFQWFTYYDRSHAQIIEGLEKSSVIVATYLQELLDEYNIPANKLVLLGFSQGAMVSVHTGLTMQDDIAGVLAFSGGLLKVDISDFEVRSQPDICFIHGTADEVVPYEMSEMGANVLTKFGVHTEFHAIKSLGHSIDMECIDIAKGFLHKVIG